MSRNVIDPQPLLFFAWLILGMLSLLASIVSLLLHPEILTGRTPMDPSVIAWTHLYLLGWLCSIFFAAGYQLTPVVTLNPLPCRWMARIHFGLHLVGMPTMVYSFFTGNYHWLAGGGTLVVAGFILFAINIILSGSVDARWSSLTMLWTSAVFWMLIGIGVAMTAVFMRMQLIDSANFNQVVGIHIHTMVLGFFLMILIAAASKLVPMFMLSPERPQSGTWISGVLLNLILFAVYFDFGAKQSDFRGALSILSLIVLIAYGCQLAYFAYKKRRKWDAGMLLFYLANGMLIPAWWLFRSYHSSAQGNADDVDTLRNAVFVVTFLAFNGCILGMAQKIVPFMLWHHLYSKHLGKAKVPQTIELLNKWTLWPIAGAYSLSAVLFLAAVFTDNSIFIRPASLAMLIAFVFVACNAPQFISHWKTPVITPFNKKPTV